MPNVCHRRHRLNQRTGIVGQQRCNRVADDRVDIRGQPKSQHRALYFACSTCKFRQDGHVASRDPPGNNAAYLTPPVQPLKRRHDAIGRQYRYTHRVISTAGQLRVCICQTRFSKGKPTGLDHFQMGDIRQQVHYIVGTFDNDRFKLQP
ncbi:hypothetical protein D3C84_775910 [compost metagenome]